MTSQRGVPGGGAQTGVPGTEALDGHRVRGPRVPHPKLRRGSHETDGVARAGIGSALEGAPPVRQPRAPYAAAPAQPPLAGTADARRASTADLREQVGGARLLASDIRLAFMLMNEARYRTFELVGVPREQANLATFVAIVMAADRLEAAKQALQNGPQPSRADVLLGLATCNQGIKAIGGPPLQQHPLLAPLVACALVSAAARPVLRQAADGIRTASHDLRVSFKHRYGHRPT